MRHAAPPAIMRMCFIHRATLGSGPSGPGCAARRGRSLPAPATPEPDYARASRGLILEGDPLCETMDFRRVAIAVALGLTRTSFSFGGRREGVYAASAIARSGLASPVSLSMRLLPAQ